MKPLILLVLLALPSFSETISSIQFEKVKVKPGDTLWGIAQTYLKNPEDWNQILKYNHLPSSDPTVALPGMILDVPKKIMKEIFQAGSIVSAINHVLLRRQETAQWKKTRRGEILYSKDTLRTLDESKAKVRFIDSQVLDLEPDSMAVILVPHGRKQEDSVSLKRGSIFIGHAKVMTPTATITPKASHTVYSAKIGEDSSTLVRVYSGIATVSAEGQNVDVPAGMETTVPPGLSAGVPQKIPHWKDFESQAKMAMNVSRENHRGSMGAGRLSNLAGEVQENPVAAAVQDGNPSARNGLGARAQGSSPASSAPSASLQKEISDLSIGNPISGYRLQVSIGRNFTSPVLDKVFDSDEKMDIQELGLKPGSYWFRLAAIDLLGEQSPFANPRNYTVFQ